MVILLYRSRPVSSSARRPWGSARPARRRGCSAAARCDWGCCISATKGFNATLRPCLCVQGRHPGRSRPVPRVLQALGRAQGNERPRVSDRTAGPRLAHAARLSALARARMTERAPARSHLIGPPDPEHSVSRGGPARMEMNHGIPIGARSSLLPACFSLASPPGSNRYSLQHSRPQKKSFIGNKKPFFSPESTTNNVGSSSVPADLSPERFHEVSPRPRSDVGQL